MPWLTIFLAVATTARITRAQGIATNVTNTTTTANSQLIITEASNANNAFYAYFFIIAAALLIALGVWRVTIGSAKYIRTLTCLNNPNQNFFSQSSHALAVIKGSLLYAPVFRKRHNREFQLSAAVTVGTLPTRLQLLFLVGYFATNGAFCFVSIHWDASFAQATKELRNRSGILAVVNMIPLFLMATRNNPLIQWLNISFDSFNLLHRWFGRIVVLESLIHTAAYIAGVVHAAGWETVAASLTQGGSMITWGLVATIAAIAIPIQASSIVRHAFYETFRMLHVVLVAALIIGLWYHLKLAGLPQVDLLFFVIAIWAVEHLARVIRTIYRNVGHAASEACVEVLPGNAVRVTMDLARPWGFRPGQHAYLYMPAIGLWTSHPFSIAWSEQASRFDDKKEASRNTHEMFATSQTTISFVIRSRTGFTAQLLKRAEAAADGKFHTRCYAEGPYGGVHNLHSYGTVVLIAGGVGITHQVPHVRDLVEGFANGTVATRKIILIWVIQSPEHLEWIRPWMTRILAMDKRREVLRIMLFVSRPRSTKEIHSPSATVQMFPGRPNMETLLDIEVESVIGAMGVSVCGSGSLSDDVRQAVRKRQHLCNIDFMEEAFSW